MMNQKENNLNPRCSIIIRAFNEERFIVRLLEGIMQQSENNFEIILVDSGSTDRTVEIANQYPVRIVSITPEEFSFGRALNLGISHAAGEFLVIASAHVYPVYPDWLERLLAPFEAPQVGLTYGKQRGGASSHFSERQIFTAWYPETSQPRQVTPFCNNANASIRRTLWEQVPYDEALSGLEDLAWAKRIMDLGHAIAYVAEAEIIHIHNETPKKVLNRYRREAIAFKRTFPEEEFHFWTFIRLFTANALTDLWQAANLKVFFQSWKSILWFRWMQFWGTYQGFRQSGPLTWQLRQTFYYPGGKLPATANPPRPVNPIEYRIDPDEVS